MGVVWGGVSENVALKRVYAVQGRRGEDLFGLQVSLVMRNRKNELPSLGLYLIESESGRVVVN